MIVYSHSIPEFVCRIDCSGIADIRSDQWPSLPQLTYLYEEWKKVSPNILHAYAQASVTSYYLVFTQIYIFLMSVTNHNGIAANKNNIPTVPI